MLTHGAAPRRGPGPLRAALCAAALLLCVLCLASCVDFRTQVGADKRIRRKIGCKDVPAAHVEAARAELKRLFGKGAGWFIKEYPRGQTTDFWAMSRAVLAQDDPFRQSVTVTKERNGLKVTYTYTEKLTDQTLFASDLERQCAEHIPVAYTVQMPGKVQSASPPGGEIGGSEVVWKSLTMADLQPGLAIEITAERWDRTVLMRDIIIGVAVLWGLWWLIVRLLVWRRIRVERIAELRERERAEKVAEDEGEEVEQPAEADEPTPPSEPPLDPFAERSAEAGEAREGDGAGTSS